MLCTIQVVILVIWQNKEKEIYRPFNHVGRRERNKKNMKHFVGRAFSLINIVVICWDICKSKMRTVDVRADRHDCFMISLYTLLQIHKLMSTKRSLSEWLLGATVCPSLTATRKYIFEVTVKLESRVCTNWPTDRPTNQPTNQSNQTNQLHGVESIWKRVAHLAMKFPAFYEIRRLTTAYHSSLSWETIHSTLLLQDTFQYYSAIYALIFQLVFFYHNLSPKPFSHV